jgi:hypothetical protein
MTKFSKLPKGTEGKIPTGKHEGKEQDENQEAGTSR